MESVCFLRNNKGLGGLGVEHITYEGDNQKKIERFLLLVYTVYNLNMIIMAIKQEWDSWVGFLLVGMLAGCWRVHIRKFKSVS